MEEKSYQRHYRFFNQQIHRLGDRLKKITLPGFDGVPIYDVFWFFVNGLQKGALNTRATSIAFNFMLGLGPAFIFLLTLIPLLPINNFEESLFHVLNGIIPANSYIAIEPVLNEIFQRHGTLPVFGLLVSLFFAQKALHGMMEAFNATFHSIETRTWYQQRLISIALVFIFYLLIILAIVLMFFSEIAIVHLEDLGIIEKDITFYLLQSGKWLIIISLTFFTISFLYYLAPSKKSPFRFFSAGSSLATILTIVASLGFTYFVNNFAQFNKFFGSIGALIALMLWMNFNALTLLIGFELNASISNASQHSIEP